MCYALAFGLRFASHLLVCRPTNVICLTIQIIWASGVGVTWRWLSTQGQLPAHQRLLPICLDNWLYKYNIPVIFACVNRVDLLKLNTRCLLGIAWCKFQINGSPPCGSGVLDFKWYLSFLMWFQDKIGQYVEYNCFAFHECESGACRINRKTLGNWSLKRSYVSNSIEIYLESTNIIQNSSYQYNFSVQCQTEWMSQVKFYVCSHRWTVPDQILLVMDNTSDHVE